MRHFFFVIAIVSLLSSCTFTMTPPPPSQGDPTMTPSMPGMASGTMTSYREDISTTSTKITSTPEFESCMKMQTNMCIQSTGMQIAQKSKDASFCKELSSADQRSSCEYAITIINAQDKKDVKVCDTLTDTNYLRQCQVQVYRQDAIDQRDITLCNKITDIYPTGTGTAMASEATMQKDQCVMQYIMTGTGSEIRDCDSLTETGTIDMCKMMIKNKPKPPVMPTMPPAPLATPALQN